MKTNTNIKNNLWQARKRSGLARKQIAALLGHKSNDEISRYEKEVYLPSLKTALKLEIIYQMPIRLLFQPLFEECRSEISAIRQQHPQLLSGDNSWFPDHAERLKHEEFCFYAQILKSHVPSQLELETATKHIIILSNIVSQYRQGRNPFPPS
jgi:transcriptional regulator with XRE-family HTH domain